MKTGQTISYATGDDGDIQAGRATDFFTLANANPFGTTARFTDELGGSTYANDIVIDWSTYDVVTGTVLGYYRRPDLLTGGNFAYAMSYCQSFTAGSFSSGWRNVNENELANVKLRTASTYWLNYPPFNITSLIFLHTSSINPLNTSQSIYQNYNTWFFNSFSTTTNAGIKPFPCRTFTVTGTTLT